MARRSVIRVKATDGQRCGRVVVAHEGLFEAAGGGDTSGGWWRDRRRRGVPRGGMLASRGSGITTRFCRGGGVPAASVQKF